MYLDHLHAKLAELRDMVEANLAVAAEQQKTAYDERASSRIFQMGHTVWLSVPTTRKLDPKWEGGWKVKAIKNPISVELMDGRRAKVVHVNRICHRMVPSM